jgi:hypothetical protein
MPRPNKGLWLWTRLLLRGWGSRREVVFDVDALGELGKCVVRGRMAWDGMVVLVVVRILLVGQACWEGLCCCCASGIARAVDAPSSVGCVPVCLPITEAYKILQTQVGTPFSPTHDVVARHTHSLPSHHGIHRGIHQGTRTASPTQPRMMHPRGTMLPTEAPFAVLLRLNLHPRPGPGQDSPEQKSALVPTALVDPSSHSPHACR